MLTCLFRQAVSVQLSSSDLNGGGGALDNIKATWRQDVKLLGNAATLDLDYDRAEKSDFLNEAKLSGSIKDVKYELTKKFGGSGIDFALETNANDGTKLEAEGNDGTGLARLTASRSTKLGSQDCDLEVSYDVGSGNSKLKMSSVLGGGVTAIGTMSGGATDVSFEYDTELTSGRTLSATVNQDGSGEVEYVDNSSIDATITATMDLSGGAPRVSVKRSFEF